MLRRSSFRKRGRPSLIAYLYRPNGGVHPATCKAGNPWRGRRTSRMLEDDFLASLVCRWAIRRTTPEASYLRGDPWWLRDARLLTIGY
jgi:hypothetical protein